jgi:ketosteroid isomerase-like protein
MSQENVEAVQRAVEAYNHRDVEALVAEAHPDIEWHPAILMMLSGKETVYRGHEGIRQLMKEIDETLAVIHGELSEFHDLGDRVLAVGRIKTRGKASGVDTEAPVGYVADFRDGKFVRVRTYLDPTEALEAAGLSE